MSGHTSEKLWVYDSIIQYLRQHLCQSMCQLMLQDTCVSIYSSTLQPHASTEKYLRSTWEVSECQKLFGDSKSDSVFPTSDPKCLLFVEGSNRFGDEGLSMFKIFTCTSCTNCKAATKLPQDCHKPDTHREMTREIMWTKEKMGKFHLNVQICATPLPWCARCYTCVHVWKILKVESIKQENKTRASNDDMGWRPKMQKNNQTQTANMFAGRMCFCETRYSYFA